MNRASRSYDFLWLSLTLLPLLLIAVLLPIQPHDYWWYLRLGRDILTSGAVPAVDAYSSTRAGQPLVYQSWASAVTFHLVYQFGGIPLTFLLLAALIGSTYALLWVLVRRCGAGPRLAALLTLLAGLAGGNNWSARPQLFAYPLFLLALWLLFKWQDREHKFLWLLVPLGLLWANLHGSFPLLFILLGAAAVFGNGDRKRLLAVAAGTIAVTLINPRGMALWGSIVDTFLAQGIRDLSPEWLPPMNQGWGMNLFFAWLILLIPLASFSRRFVTAFEWLTFLVFLWFSLSGLRYMIWGIFLLAVMSTRLIPEHVMQWFDRPLETRFPEGNYGLGLVLLLLPLTVMPGVRERWWQGAPPALDPHTPVDAVAWLADHPELPGMMWNDVVFGSYLIHALPERPVWIDTRIQVIYTPEQAERYLMVQSARPGWEDLLEQQGVNLLVLAHTQPALVEAVKGSDRWCMKYQDDAALIFSRCEPLP
jgi:hypothetical protein